ncbi:excinuclease ABC subunit UvrA [Bartonella sp. HY406]|uniref:excinuclease ABC subunit UvrA n=1 Tax=Bartonella sp. HY406 TaxID=2979331 RepID=UPI0021C962B1|nr:excinuclease ABC subunit UvrA [Bartonella sp. HY406]UXN02830.1 excinuclease ABC subunit UvrA [Bartonella sp. HY406]
MDKRLINVVNATENNLKGVSVTIPKNVITVITGVSGSGKSSLVFDTIGAESRRELNETFPSFVQRYLPRYERPHVDIIENLPVTIIINQKRLGDNARSTLGTYTDIYTFLRLLFSRIGQPFVGYSDVFSFNHPKGKCVKCDGLGVYRNIILNKLVDFDKSLNDDAIDFPTFHPGAWRWKRYAYSGLFDLDKKISDYSPEELKLFLYSPQIKLKNPPEIWPVTAKFEGIVPRMERSIINSDEGKRHAKRVDEFVVEETCPACHGTRVNEKIQSCKINGLSISDMCLLPLTELLDFIEEIKHPLAGDIKIEIRNRLSALINIGLGYLTLSRATGTLSGGEGQRVKIARHINSALSDILYVLDEPSIGLHPKDIENLTKSLFHLKSRGNSILMVEHNPALIRIAEHIIDMGPGAGENGGQIVYQGSIDGLMKADTYTGKELRQTMPIKTNARTPTKWIELKDINFHNIQGLSVDMPLGVLTVICGVAGSGKSSLMDVLLRNITQPVIAISQKHIGISIRSTLSTYMDINDHIRKLFAQANDVDLAYFSYNSKGACPICKGKGVIVTDMSFMDDIKTVCESCHGARYNDKVLKYQYRGKNIAEVIAMSVTESIAFFSDEPFVVLLQALEKVGLDYIRLNQALSTLSGGELQRLKLASYLNKKGTLFVLDEPTVGLHMEDVKKLIKLFNQLVEDGNSVIIAEHNLSVIKQADWLIELGPEAGAKGGKIIYSGALKDIHNSTSSITRQFLL